MRDDRVLRIDPASLRVVDVVQAGGDVRSVAFGFGSVCATDATGQVVRISPTG
jgi:hypothetical protein